MIKDFFQQTQDSIIRLRTEYFKASDYLQKGQHHMKLNLLKEGKKYYDFDLNSQEYFHECLDDLVFQRTEVQEDFYDHISKFMQSDLNMNYNRGPPSSLVEKQCKISPQNNLKVTKEKLILHFVRRIHGLKHKKYLTLLRFHNSIQINPNNLLILQSRIRLIDAQIQSTLNRLTRLEISDQFGLSSNKPVPVDQNGNVTYKILDDQQSSHTNISRDDIEVYLRAQGHQYNVLSLYWKYYYKLKYIPIKSGLDIFELTQNSFYLTNQKQIEIVEQWCYQFLNIIKKNTQDNKSTQMISYDSIITLLSQLYGISDNKPFRLPLVPSLSQQLIININNSMKAYFTNIRAQFVNLSDVVPKLLNFVSIVFRYQNKYVIIEQQEDIKLGLEDDIDLQKQLLTLLQLSWVNKYVKLQYTRYNVKMQLNNSEFPQNNFTHKFKSEATFFEDLMTKQIIKSMDINNYNIWRGYIKSHSQSVIRRSKAKFKDFEKCKHYQLNSNSDITLSYLNKLYHTKKAQPEFQDKMKKVDREIFQMTIQKLTISNPVFVQAYQSLYSLHIRDMNSTLRNILNANRCYFKKLSLDLRVINKKEFKYECQDNFLVDTNKLQRQHLDKITKKSPELFSIISLQKDQQAHNTSQHVEEVLSKHSIYSYDKIKKVFLSDQEIPQLYVMSTYRSKKCILYEITVKDMQNLQHRILQIASKYISKFEGYIQINSLQPLVDRYKLLHELYEWELRYQYQKFKQVEILMQIYQHTCDPLNSYKIMTQIFELQAMTPRIDFDETYFATSYQKQLQIIKHKNTILNKLKDDILNEEINQVNAYHSRLTKNIKIPYYQYGIYYGDLEPDKIKRERKQSLVSKKSFVSQTYTNSKNKSTIIDKNFGISEEKQQDDQQDLTNQGMFNLKNYDEYLLTKGLQQIFHEMTGERNEFQQENQRKQINEPNRCIHRRVEGGPHCLMRLNQQSKMRMLTGNTIQFINFFENICWAPNILELLKSSIQKIRQKYFKSNKVLLQLELQRNLLSHAAQILSQFPIFKAQHINKQIKWDQCYHFVVKASKRYQQLMKNSLQPPSSLMNAFNLPKIIESLPDFSQLQYFDIHTLNCLLTLKKPNNILLYRELSLAMNLMEVFSLTKIINCAFYQKQAISNAYKYLGKYLGIQVVTNTMEYLKQNMFVLQQLKPIEKFGSNFLYPDALDKLRVIAQAQKTNLKNFLSLVQYHEKRVRQILILQRQMKMFMKYKKYFHNGVLQQSRISIELQNLKNLSSRVKPLVGFYASQFKDLNYLKSKKRMLEAFQQQYSKSNLLIQNINDRENDKANKYLISKKLWLIKQKLSILYCKDLQKSAQIRLQFLDMIQYNELIAAKSKSLPFNNLFSQQQYNRTLQQKFYYDQKSLSVYRGGFGQTFEQGLLVDPFYLHTTQQFFSQHFQPQQSKFLDSFDSKAQFQLIQLQISKTKQQAYQNILNPLPLQQYQIKGLQYLCKMNSSMSGYFSIYEEHKVHKLPLQYKQISTQQKLLQYYIHLNQYINANIIQMMFTCQDINVLKQILKSGKNFEKMYPLIDSNEIYQNINNNIVAAMYVYEVKQYEILKKAKTSNSQTIVIDELTDFFVRRVQGLGLIRQIFLPFVQELKTFRNKFKNKTHLEVVNFLKIKTKNIFRLIFLGILQNNKHITDPVVQNRLKQLSNTMFSVFRSAPIKPSSQDVKIDIDQKITSSLHEHYQFNNKVTNYKDILSKLYYILINSPLNFNKYIVDFVSSIDPQYKYLELRQYKAPIKSQGFLFDVLSNLSQLKENNRLRFLSHIKYINQNVKDMLLLKKSDDWMEMQLSKQKLLKMDIQISIFINATLGVKEKQFINFSQEKYNEMYNKQYNEIDTKAVIIVNNYEEYIGTGKLSLTKQQKVILSTPLPLNNKDWSNRQLQIYRTILRKIIINKLARQYFKVSLINTCTDMIQKQRIPINQPSKIININLVPRVKLNSCFSSPLRQNKKTYISNTHKIAFVQAFINRLRNKVSRVDLLSSGCGFVITVSDLENCVNFLNKSLFSFTQKQFKHRMESFSLYWQMIMESLNLKNKEISQLKTKIRYLNGRVDNINQTAYIKKASNLLNQNNKLCLRVQQTQKLSQGLEDRIRKVVEIQYHNQIEQLKKQNQHLKRKFKEFQQLMVHLAKDETKYSFTTLMNQFKIKTSELLHKNMDVGTPTNFYSNQNPSFNIETTKKQQKPKTSLEVESNLFQQHSGSYQTSKLLSKMRIMNALKIGIQKQKQYKQDEKSKKQLAQLRSIHDVTIVKTQKELLLRKQLDKIQIMLSSKMKELETYRNKCEMLQNQNDKLKTWKTNKQKVIENLKNSVIESQSAQRTQQILPQSRRSNVRSQAKSEIIPSPRKSFSINKKQIKQTKDLKPINSKLYGTQPLLVDTSYQLSNKDVAWKEKCQQLFIQNKRLQKVIQKMKVQMSPIRSNRTTKQGVEEAMNMSQFSKDQPVISSNNVLYDKTPSSRRKRFPNLNYKYKMSGHQS